VATADRAEKVLTIVAAIVGSMPHSIR